MWNRISFNSIANVVGLVVLVCGGAGCSRVNQEIASVTDLCSADRGYPQQFDDPIPGDAFSLLQFPSDIELMLKSARYTIEIGKPVRNQYDRPNMSQVVEGWNPKRMCFHVQYGFLENPRYGTQAVGLDNPEIKVSEVIAPQSQIYWPFQAMEQEQVAVFVDSGVPWRWTVARSGGDQSRGQKSVEVSEAVRFALHFDRNGIMGPVRLDPDMIGNGRRFGMDYNWSLRFPYVHAQQRPDTMYDELQGGTGQFNRDLQIYEEKIPSWKHGVEDSEFSKRRTKIVIQRDPVTQSFQRLVIRTETTMYAYVIFNPNEANGKSWVYVSAPQRIVSELEYDRH